RVRPADPVDQACWKLLRIVVTFHLVCLGWLIFRAGSIEQALGMLSSIVHRPAIPPASLLIPLLCVAIPLVVVQLAQSPSKDLNVIARTPWYVRSVFFTTCFYAIVLGGAFESGKQFIYF